LTVLLGERSAGRFALGLRYDSRYKASVLLSSALGSVAGPGLSAQANARLGQQIYLDLGMSRSVGDGKAATFGARAAFAHSPFDLFDRGHEVAQARVDLGAISALLTRRLGTAVQLSAIAKAEHARWLDEVSAVDSPAIARTFYSVAGLLEVDTYDRGLFPRRGLGLRALSEWGNRLTGAGGAYAHQFAAVRGYLPLERTLSVWGGVTVGASGGQPPPHYQFFLGGANSYYLFPDRAISFVGLHTQERRGRHVQKVEVGAQWEFLPEVFGQVSWNAGNVYDRWTWDPARYVDGLSFAVGAKTLAGRVNVSVSGSGQGTWPILELDLGYPF
jgi:outer membrane protein assembly factor BamA